MPTSSSLGKIEIRNWFNARNDIKSIVDFGCGSGTYIDLLGKQKYKWIAHLHNNGDKKACNLN